MTKFSAPPRGEPITLWSPEVQDAMARGRRLRSEAFREVFRIFARRSEDDHQVGARRDVAGAKC